MSKPAPRSWAVTLKPVIRCRPPARQSRGRPHVLEFDMSKLRTIAILPTLFTLGNLACGFFAIVVAARVETPTSAAIPQAPAIHAASPVKIFQALDKSD